MAYPDGTLLTPVGGAEVDVISRGLRHWIPDPPTFVALGFQWADIRTISLPEWNSIPQGVPIVSIVAQPSSQGLRRLEDTRPAYAPTGSDFTTLVAQGLGAMGTGADGWDATINNPVTALDAVTPSLGVMDAAVIAADFVEGAFEAAEVSPLVLDLLAFLDDGDNLLTISGF